MTTKQLDVDKVHEAIDITIQALHEKEDQLREMEIALTNFVNLEAEFRGQGGQAIRDFYATCHIPFIQLLRLFSEDYEHILQQIKQSLDFVEPAPGGFIDQAFIENDVQDGLDRVSQTAMALTDSANETLRSIQDIISIPLIDDSDVQQAIHVAKKEANSVVDKVLQFDHTGTVSLQSIKDNLKTLGKYVMEMHEAMGGGHLSVKDFSVDQLHYLPTHSKLTEVLQERSTEIKSTADPREEELAILEAERAAIEAEELARLEAEQAAIEAEEARLAEQQALEEVEEDKSWWSKTVSAVTDTVEKTIDTVGNAASSAYNYVTENPAASLSAVVDFVPVVGNLKAGIEAATGYDPLTGRRLEPWERAVSGGAILGGAAVKGASKVAKFAKNADNVGDVGKYVGKPNYYGKVKAGNGKPPENFTPTGAGRKGAIREAKRASGIPMSEQPRSVSPAIDKRGKPIDGGGKDYYYGDGKVIREHYQHRYPDNPLQNRNRHFNDIHGNHYDY
jgi:predicted ribonuclease toxin of YeeF-YezG toxin-antitoxin module